MWTRYSRILKVSTSSIIAGIESRIDHCGYIQSRREGLSSSGFRGFPTKATMILHARVVWNTLEHGYSREKNLFAGRTPKLLSYYGCMEFVSQPV